MKQEEIITTKTPSFKELFFLFLIGCVVGTYYEQFLTLFNHGVWVSRRGLIYGPFNPVYGVGLLIIVIVMAHSYDQRRWQINFLIIALLGGLTEYFFSYFQQFFFNTHSWDYSTYLLNINGRTTIPFMILWGLFGLLILYVVYPDCLYLIRKIPSKYLSLMYRCMLVFMIFNCLITIVAISRWSARQQNIAPTTGVGTWVDKTYSDAYLEKKFPNMVVKK